MANDEIKKYAKDRQVCLWEIAQRFGITDAHFSRKLRFEFSEAERSRALQYVDEIAAKREKA